MDKKASKIDLQVRFKKNLDNKYFYKICKSLELPEEVLIKNTSSLLDCAKEFEKCSNCKGLVECKNMTTGYMMKATKNNNGIAFSYVSCKYLNKQNYKKNVSLFDLPIKLKNASMKDVYVDDKSRKDILKKMKEFKDSYLNGEKPKGIYLYGSFGAGKSYLISALFNDLAQNNVKSVIVHVPELIRSIKDSFDKDYSDRFDEVMNAELLLLDDIGAEYLTPWSRDEVLEPILQYRMDQELPTFFTSNYSNKEIEDHFTINGDKLKAKRIIERINQVSTPIELVGKNRRV